MHTGDEAGIKGRGAKGMDAAAAAWSRKTKGRVSWSTWAERGERRATTMRTMKSPGGGERREQGGTQQEHQPLPPCISSSRLTVPPLRPGNWPGGPPPACRFAEEEVVEGGSLVYSEGVAMICDVGGNSCQHVAFIVDLETPWRDCPENKQRRGLTLSTTFPKMPSSPLTSSPPFFAEHSMNIQGGSREAANAWPSAVETVRENSCECRCMRESRTSSTKTRTRARMDPILAEAPRQSALTLSTLFPTIIRTTSLLAGPVPANVSSSLIHDDSDSNVSRAVMS